MHLSHEEPLIYLGALGVSKNLATLPNLGFSPKYRRIAQRQYELLSSQLRGGRGPWGQNIGREATCSTGFGHSESGFPKDPVASLPFGTFAGSNLNNGSFQVGLETGISPRVLRGACFSSKSDRSWASSPESRRFGQKTETMSNVGQVGSRVCRRPMTWFSQEVVFMVTTTSWPSVRSQLPILTESQHLSKRGIHVP